MKHGFLNALLALALFWHSAACAQAISKEESERIWADAKAAALVGPAQIPLKVQDALQGTLALPAGHSYIPQPHATQVLNAMGNPGNDERLQGLVFPDGDAPWFMSVRFERSGFVKDDDAQKWDVDELLQSYKDGTEAANAERKKMGVPEMEILGWAQKPVYDAGTHRLAWAMSSRDKGATANEPQGVNYNTYALGREGYFSMNLVTDLDALPTYKPAAHTLLDGMQFAEGKRYADFNPSTDRVAEYGLAALVVGAAAKKLGLFATLALLLAKFWKVGAIAAIAFGGLLFRWLKKRKAKQADDEFAHTVMVDHNAPERTLPQPLAPHPHADQVRTGQHGDKV